MTSPVGRPEPLPVGNRLLGDLVQAPLFFSATAFFGTLSLTASLFEKSGQMQHRIARLWAKTSMRIARSPVTIAGEDNLRRYPVAVFASNHLSFMDTPALFSAVPFQFRILARQSLWKVPFIGWHLNRSGQIAVNTDNASFGSLSAGIKALKAGMPLIVFPEGGRTRDGHVTSFMDGPAYMAIRTGVPLVPMAIVGTYELLPIGARHFYPQRVKLVVGEPIESSRYTIRQVEELTERLKAEIGRLYYASSHLEPSLEGPGFDPEEPARRDLREPPVSELQGKQGF